jgi:transposase
VIFADDSLKRHTGHYGASHLATASVAALAVFSLCIIKCEGFPNANKLAKFAGIAPVNFSSTGKGKDMCPKQGNRRLQAIFYFLAIQMIQLSVNGKLRNRIFRDYYLKWVEEGKNKQQALISLPEDLWNAKEPHGIP